MVRVYGHQFSKFLDLTLLFFTLGLLSCLCFLATTPLELMIHLGFQLALEGFEFEGVLQALRIYAEVSLFQRMEWIMEKLVLLTASLNFGHQSLLLLLWRLLIFIQNFRQFVKQLQKLIIIQIPSGRAYPDIDIVQLLLSFWFFREDVVLLEEMHQFLIIDGLGLMLNPLETLLYPSQMVLTSVVLKDQLEVCLFAGTGCLSFGLRWAQF